MFIYMHICVSERDYWDSSLQIPTADFQEVLHDDKAALAWLEALRRIGIVLPEGGAGRAGPGGQTESEDWLSAPHLLRVWTIALAAL